MTIRGNRLDYERYKSTIPETLTTVKIHLNAVAKQLHGLLLVPCTYIFYMHSITALCNLLKSYT